MSLFRNTCFANQTFLLKVSLLKESIKQMVPCDIPNTKFNTKFNSGQRLNKYKNLSLGSQFNIRVTYFVNMYIFYIYSKQRFII